MAKTIDKDTIKVTKDYVSFDMYWECHGRQEIPLPKGIDKDDTDALIKYIKSVWNKVPIPTSGDTVDMSDELNEEGEIYCYTEEMEENYMAQESGRLRVEWENLNEGLCGDYTGKPDDINFLRFTVYVRSGDSYEQVDDASYCTEMPADTEPEILLKALKLLLEEYSVLQWNSDVSVKKIGERLSHMCPEDFMVITDDMIRAGIRKNIVKFVIDPNMKSGTVCQIGDNWFYFGGPSAEAQNPEEYVKNTGEDDLVREICDVLDCFRHDGPENRDEYLYYYAYLRENLEKAVPDHED